MAARTEMGTDPAGGPAIDTWPHRIPYTAPDVLPHPLTSMDSMTRDAYLQGYDEGERTGYVSGWRYGFVSGAFAGMAACGLVAFAIGWIVGVR